MLRTPPFHPPEISSSFGRIRTKYLSCCAGIALATAGLCHAEDFSAQRQLVEDLARLTEAPAMREADGFPAAGEIKAIYFDALEWKGKPTKVFAWLGVPKNPSGKVPGIVLVHGGGGTAFAEWAKLLNDRGFAAISRKDPEILTLPPPTRQMTAFSRPKACAFPPCNVRIRSLF